LDLFPNELESGGIGRHTPKLNKKTGVLPNDLDKTPVKNLRP
jgi:hypothetical protein